jgi:hypothetical protein
MSTGPWYKRTLRWAQTNLTEIDPARYDVDWWREHWRKTRVQGAIINAGGIVAYYPSNYPLHHRAVHLGDRDLYGEVAAAAREAGLVVVARMDSNRVAHDLYRAHPDWIAHDVDGKPFRQADKYVTCINSPYYTDFLPQVMEEIIERTQPDGFTDNSWAGLPRARICHCRYCREKFQNHAGLDLPRGHDWDSEAYRRWISWNYQLRSELFAFNNSVTTKAGGEHCRWAGMISGDVLNNGNRFIDLPDILEQTAIVMLDHQRRTTIHGFDQNTEAGKRLHELAGWDKLIPESMPQYQLGAPSFRLASMPAAEIRLWSSAGFAGGIMPWWHHIGSCHDDRRQYTTAEPIFTWHEANEAILENRRPVADVGVVWSQANHDFFGRNDAIDRTDAPYRGVVKALDRAGLTSLPVHADRLDDAAKRFGCLVLPNLGAMSEAQIAAIQAFVAEGASVIATGETSQYDAVGDDLGSPALGELFGVSRKSGSHGGIGAPDTNIETYARHSYLRLHPEGRDAVYGPKDPTAPGTSSARHPILAGLDQTDSLTFGGFLPAMTVAKDVEVLATFIPPFPIFPPETSWMQTPSTDLPAITVRETSSGARLVWFVADLDRCFVRDDSFEHGLLIGNAVRWALNRRPVLEISGGHGYVTGNLYTQDGRKVLHLNNRLVTSPVPGRQHALVALGPITVRLALDAAAKAPEEVELRVAGGTISAAVEDGVLVFEVAAVEDHEVVVIDGV